MKVLNCNCKQCKYAKKRHNEYLLQIRKVRRVMQQKLRYAVSRKDFDIDLPEKHRGTFAA